MDDQEKLSVNSTDIDWIKAYLVEIKTEVKKTNGRVTELELWKARSVGIVIGVSSICAAIFAVVKFLLGL
jgi:preprotein translocase subunit SecE